MKTLVMIIILSLAANTAFADGNGLNFTDMEQWVTFSALLNDSGKSISLFKSSWVVPPIPTSSDANPVYLWNGIEPIDHSLVVQPVLAWYGSGDWVVSCFSVTAAGDVEESQRTTVKPGDTVTGMITLISAADGTFNYQCEFEGLANSVLAYSGPELVLAVEVLEQYNIDQCSDLAPGTNFTAITLETGGAVANLPWHTFVNSTIPSCGQSTTVVNGSLAGGEVDISTVLPNSLAQY